MTDDRSLERAARSWIESGPTRAPDRAVEAALLLVDTTPQERDLRIPWRLPTMFNNRLAVFAAAALIVVAGAFTFSRLTGNLGPGTGPSPAPSVSPTPNPSPTALNTSAGYTNLAGWIVFEHFGRQPDGSSTSFNGDGRWIWLVHADGTGLHELAPNTTNGKVSPDISPDGQTVVFASWEPNAKIYQVPIDGGTPTALDIPCPAKAGGECDLGDPAYSADGKQVAFVKLEITAATLFSEIDVVDLASGQVHAIASTRVAQVVNQPAWSPDGRQIAYHVDTQTGLSGFGAPSDPPISKISIKVVNADGTGLHELPIPAGSDRAGDPDWSPDGSLIVFSTFPNREGEGDGTDHPGIYTIHPDGTSLTEICGELGLGSPQCLGGGIAPTWTADGKHIFFWGFRTWAMMDPDGSNMAHINQGKLTWYAGNLGYGYFAELQPTS
jgi:Tol biopolymer transport system component